MSAWSRPTCGCSFLLSGTLTATAACLASAGCLSRRPVSGQRGTAGAADGVAPAGGVLVGDGLGAAVGPSLEHADRATPAVPGAPSSKGRRAVLGPPRPPPSG